MKEQFEYGELVEVRYSDLGKWEKRCYIATAPKGTYRYIAVMPDLIQEDQFRESGAYVYPFAQIRKIQKPEPGLIDIEQPETIEQRMDKFEAILNGAIKHINEQIQSIKNIQIKDNEKDTNSKVD